MTEQRKHNLSSRGEPVRGQLRLQLGGLVLDAEIAARGADQVARR